MDVIDAIKERKSIRAFKSDPVTLDLLKKIIEQALARAVLGEYAALGVRHRHRQKAQGDTGRLCEEGHAGYAEFPVGGCPPL